MSTAVFYTDLPIERISVRPIEQDKKTKSNYVLMHIDGESLPQIQLNYDDVTDEFLVTPFGLSNPQDAMGADAKRDASDGSVRMNIDLQVARGSPLKDFFDRLDEHVMELAVAHADTWFDGYRGETDKNFIRRSLSKNFVRSVYVHKPKQAPVGWSEERYEPVLRTKLSVFKPTPESRAKAAAENKPLREGATMQLDVLHPSRKYATPGNVEQIARFTRLGRVIIEIGRIWFMSGTFGIQYNIRSALLDVSDMRAVQPLARPGGSLIPRLENAPKDDSEQLPPAKRSRTVEPEDNYASPSGSEAEIRDTDLE